MKRQLPHFRLINIIGLLTASIFLGKINEASANSVQLHVAGNNNPSTNLKLILLDLQKFYNVEIVFEDKAVVNKIAEPFNPKFSIEKNLSNVLQKTGLGYKKLRKDTYLITTSEVIEKSSSTTKLTENTSSSVGQNIAFEAKIPSLSSMKSPISIASISVITVKGKVVDEKGDPMIGVSIQLKGTTTGTNTNSAGAYSIAVPKTTSILVFTFIGFTSREVLVGNQTDINVALSSDVQALGEVVVVGYGTQQKVNLTGAVGVASGELLKNRAIASVGEGLQGIIPNLNVNVRNGDPAADVLFNIRGFESINGGAPLILVDGVPMDLNRINPNDIKTISVLKDASSAAIYGSRAAFGVILVETKKAAAGKVNITFNAQFSLAKSIFNLDPVTDPYEFVLARNIAATRDGGTPAYDADYVAGTKAYSENPIPENAWKVVSGVLRFYGQNDYQKRVLNDYAPTKQYDMSISGGSDKTKFYASVGYLSKDGYYKTNNQNFQRYNVLLKGEFKANDWLSFDEKVVLNSQINDKPTTYDTGDISINSIIRVVPIRPIIFPDLPFYVNQGDRDVFAPYIGRYISGVNLLPFLEQGGRNSYTNNDLWLTQGVTLTPMKGLKIRSDFTYNIFNRVFQDVQNRVEVVGTNLLLPVITDFGVSTNDNIISENQNNTYQVFNIFAEYEMPKINGHGASATIGFNQESGYYSLVGAKNNSLLSPTIADLSATTGLQSAYGRKSNMALRGAFYRINYNYKDRYLIESNGRYDGSSRFSKATRFDFFPSVSAAWRISNEEFMKGASGWINNLKIRASYGTLGNQLLGANTATPYSNSNLYPYIATLGASTEPYLFSSTVIPTVIPAGLVSPTLTWETVASKNIGIDFNILKGKLDFSFDAYTRDTKNMLINVTYPSILGTAAPKENAGDLRTTGWELALTWKDRIKSDFKYSVTLALSDWTAEITKYNNPTGVIPNNPTGAGATTNNYYVGQKLGEIWGYESVGIFQTLDDVTKAPTQNGIGSNWRPGDMQFRDLNGDGKIDAGNGTLSNPGDRRVIGNTTPRYTFGINTDLSYKNFRVSAFFQGIGSRDYYPPTASYNWFFPFQTEAVEKYFIAESWSETNRDAFFPAPSYLQTKNIVAQTRYLQNAGYIRLKNVTVSYDLPQKFLDKVKISLARIFVSGMNLWEYSTILKPLDPETIQSGQVEYPMQRIGTLGFNISF